MSIFRDKDFLIFKLAPFVLFIVVLYFPVFLHLGSDAIGMWDESLFALRAYFFAHTDQYLMNFNEIDTLFPHPNTKPPLFTWIQGYFFRWFGYTELSLRLPIAITVFIMLIFMVRFASREFNNPSIGYFAALVLITSQGFVDKHISRTGDHDAVLAFEFLLVLVYFYKLIAHPEKQNKYVWLVALFLAAAALTKSVAGLFPLPALFLFALYKKRVLPLLRSWHTWGAIVMFLILVLGYYFYREWQHPGFVQSVWNEEIGGRYMDEIDGHRHEWYWYLKRMFDWRFTPWLYFIPITSLFIFTKKGKSYRDMGIVMLLGTFTILTIISISETKCEWYDAGTFPMLAFFVAIGIDQVRQAILTYVPAYSKWKKSWLTLFLVVGLFALPYHTIIKKISHPTKGWSREQFGEFMRQISPDTKYTLATKTLNTCATFYQRVAKNVNGKDIEIKRYGNDYEPGELVMTYQDLTWAKKRYNFKVVHQYKKLKIIEIESLKE